MSAGRKGQEIVKSTCILCCMRLQIRAGQGVARNIGRPNSYSTRRPGLTTASAGTRTDLRSADTLRGTQLSSIRGRCTAPTRFTSGTVHTRSFSAQAPLHKAKPLSDRLLARSKRKSEAKVTTARPRRGDARTRSISKSAKSVATKGRAAKGPVASNDDVQDGETTAKLSASRSTDSRRLKSEEELFASKDCEKLSPRGLDFQSLDIPKPPIPTLAHNLDRVLFNEGVHNLQDRHSGVYNFDPYLETIMPMAEFNFDALPAYTTSSRDKTLAKIASQNDIKYVGSTSSMTSMLTQFHYLLSNWRELNFSSLSRGFDLKDTKNSRNFTEIYRAPASIFLRWRNGTYAIDADKELSSSNILMYLGHSLEKLLTQSPQNYERYRRTSTRDVSGDERNAPQAFHYSKQGDVLMRSQLDAQDGRLPDTGVFDLKTRAVLPIRMNSGEYESMLGYQILSEQGSYESYEREFYDMFRSTALKYSLQVRMGRMAGIFIAYHNVEEIFGFQFMNLSQMDEVLHNQRDTCLGDQEFRASIHLMNEIMDRATAKFPKTSIRLHFETPSTVPTRMNIFAEPVTEDEVEAIQNSNIEEEREYARQFYQAVDDRKTKTPTPDASDTNHPSADDHDSSSQSPTIKSATITEPRPARLLAMRLWTRNMINNTHVVRPTDLSTSDKWEIQYRLEDIKDPSEAKSLYESTKLRRKNILAWDKDGSDNNDDTPTTSPGAEADGTPEEGKGMSLAEAMARKKATGNTSTSSSQSGSTGGSGGSSSSSSSSRHRGFEHYIAQLRKLSDRGKVLREERLARAEGKEKVVLGMPAYKASGAAGRAAQAVQGMDAASTGRTEDGVYTLGRKTDQAEREGARDVPGYLGWLYAARR